VKLRIAGLSVALLVAVLTHAGPAAGDTSFGSWGSGAGQMIQPLGLAVDDSTGDLYVLDAGGGGAADAKNSRVDVFDAEHHFLRAFGWGVLNGASSLQVCTAQTGCLAGVRGPGSGEISYSKAIEVDNDPLSPSYRHVFVTEDDNFRVQEFTPQGAFVRMIGPGVDKSTGGNVCTAASGHLCGEGDAQGTEGRKRLTAAVAPNGQVDLFESDPVDQEVGGQRQWIYETTLYGYAAGAAAPTKLAEFGPETNSPNSAVVSPAGTLFAAMNAGLEARVFDATTGESRGAIPLAVNAYMAFDPSGQMFAVGAAPTPSGFGTVVAQSSEAGVVSKLFGYEAVEKEPGGIAVYPGADGTVYVAERSAGARSNSRIVYLSLPEPGPITVGQCSATGLGNVGATLTGFFNPEGSETTYHFEYVDEAEFAESGFEGEGVRVTPDQTSPADFELDKAQATVSLTPETTYHCRVVAENAEGTSIGRPGEFTTLEPFEIDAVWATGVGRTTATLGVEANPLGIPASGYLEYVSQAQFDQGGFSQARRVPDGALGEEPLDFGAGSTPVRRGVSLAGLQPGERYLYRAVVTDSFFPAGKTSGVGSFRTFASDAALLPDARGWEQVSPIDKNSGSAGVPAYAEPAHPGGGDSAGFERIEAASPSGETMAFTSFTSFADPVGAQGTSQYLARRGEGGWSTENLTPPGFIKETLRPPFKGFTESLGFSGVSVTEPALTPDAVKGMENLYLRDNQTGALTAMTTGQPTLAAGEDELCERYGGSSEDGRRVYFAANGAFADARVGRGFSLYEWQAGRGLTVVSRLPSGNPAPPSSKNNFGPSSHTNSCENGTNVLHNVVSADGSKAFWTYQPATGPSRLYAWTNGENVQLDAVDGGPGPAGGGVFLAANRQGSVVFFSDSNRLTADASEALFPASEPDLYRYDFNAPEGERLTDLTPEVAGGSGFRGALGAGEDGASIYFAANGVLAPGASAGDCSGEGQNGEGECNLYLWEAGKGTRFVSRVAGLDDPGWTELPFEQTARVSADGRFLAFASVLPLTGFDNRVEGSEGCQEVDRGANLTGDPRCSEAFVYDSVAETLVCASCGPTGGRPTGPVILPGLSNMFEPTRNLSSDGSRFFFATRTALSPVDTNQAADVYEYERVGVGSCTEASDAFSQAAGGCDFLVSGGQSPNDSYFLDASSSGRDVFFSTRQKLVGWDQDDQYDVYDAREGGGFPEPGPEEDCGSLDACHAAPVGAPGVAGVATPGFVGPEGVAPCPAGRHRMTVKGKSRCVGNKQKHSKRKGKGKHKGKGKGKGKGKRRHGKKIHGSRHGHESGGRK
jgi:hypothetical protein